MLISMMSEMEIRKAKSELTNYIEYENKEIADLLEKIDEKKYRIKRAEAQYEIYKRVLGD